MKKFAFLLDFFFWQPSSKIRLSLIFFGNVNEYIKKPQNRTETVPNRTDTDTLLLIS